MKRRFTVETIASGQQRDYGPTVHRARITFELEVDGVFQLAADLTEAEVLRHAKFHYGWVQDGDPRWPENAMGQHFATKLSYIKQVDPGVWEWETSSPYTD